MPNATAEPTLTVRYDDGGHVTLWDPDGHQADYWRHETSEPHGPHSITTAGVVEICGTFGWQRPPEPVPDNDDLPGPLPGAVDADGWPVGLAVTDWTARHRPEPPSLIYSDELGHGLAYEGDITWLVGPAGSGKTWLALLAALETIAHERPVLWIEGLGDENPLHERCEALNAAGAENGMKHVSVTDWRAAEPEDLAAAAAWVVRGSGLIVIDAANSTGSGESSESFYRWAAVLPVAARCTRLILGHPTKRLVDGQRLPGSIGSIAALTGASNSLYVEGTAWARRKGERLPGSVTVTLDKDRHGHLGQIGERIASVQGDWTEDGHLRLQVRAPLAETAEATHEGLVVAAVHDSPGIGATALRDAVSTAAKATGVRTDWQTVAAAIKRCSTSGDIEKRKGKGKRVHYFPAGHPDPDLPDNVTPLRGPK